MKRAHSFLAERFRSKVVSYVGGVSIPPTSHMNGRCSVALRLAANPTNVVSDRAMRGILLGKM